MHNEFRTNSQVSVKVQGRFASNSVLMLRKAALESLGIAIVPLYCVKEDLKSGALRRYIENYSLTGLTSNPTIFDKAISEGTDYDEQIRFDEETTSVE